MRAACCEATVLRNGVIAPDIRLLTVVWPDRDHAPPRPVLHPALLGADKKPPSLSSPSASTAGTRTAAPLSFCIRWWAKGTESWHSSSSRIPSAHQSRSNGFDVPEIVKQVQKIAVVGGGIGTAPVCQLTRQLAAAA